MTGLQWTNAVVLAIAVTMAVMMGVVCLLYGVYLNEAPQLLEQWPLLTQSTALFVVLAVVAAVAFHGLRRETSWRWLGQAALMLTMATTMGLLWRLLTS